MFRLIKVVGSSMLPTLSHGDYVLIRKARSRTHRLRPGFVVVAEHARLGRIVKRVVEVTAEGVRLAGDNPESTGTAEIGLIPHAQLRGRAILAITPNGLRYIRNTTGTDPDTLGEH